jgi:type III secretory pathway component EscR
MKIARARVGAPGRGLAAVQLTFFVLVDGWMLVAGSLIQSYGT